MKIRNHLYGLVAFVVLRDSNNFGEKLFSACAGNFNMSPKLARKPVKMIFCQCGYLSISPILPFNQVLILIFCQDFSSLFKITTKKGYFLTQNKFNKQKKGKLIKRLWKWNCNCTPIKWKILMSCNGIVFLNWTVNWTFRGVFSSFSFLFFLFLVFLCWWVFVNFMSFDLCLHFFSFYHRLCERFESLGYPKSLKEFLIRGKIH